jgi:hypothetical protein
VCKDLKDLKEKLVSQEQLGLLEVPDNLELADNKVNRVSRVQPGTLDQQAILVKQVQLVLVETKELRVQLDWLDHEETLDLSAILDSRASRVQLDQRVMSGSLDLQAIPVHRVPQDLQGQLDPQDFVETLDQLATKVSKVHKVWLDQRASQAQQASQGWPGLPETLALLDPLEPLVHQDSPVQLELWASQVHREVLALRDWLDPLASKDLLVNWVKMDCLEPQGPKVLSAVLEQLATQEQLEVPGIRDHQDLKEQRVIQEHLELLGTLALLVTRGNKACKEPADLLGCQVEKASKEP